MSTTELAAKGTGDGPSEYTLIPMPLSPVLAVNSATSPAKPSSMPPAPGVMTTPLQSAEEGRSDALATRGTPPATGTITSPSSPVDTKRRELEASQVMRSHAPRGANAAGSTDDVTVIPITPAHDGTGGLATGTYHGGGGGANTVCGRKEVS